MIKAVLFDLDQTLIDFLKMKKNSLREAIDSMIDAGLEIDPDKAFKKIWDLFDRYGIENNQIFQRFLENTLGKVDFRILAHGINGYRRVRHGFLSSYPGAKKTLLKLKQKGLRLAIVSDAPKLKCWLRLTSIKLDDFFDIVISYDDSGEFKPSKKPFQIALNTLDIKPEECLMVGDNPDRDIKGASELGIKTCLAKYGQFVDSDIKPDFSISNIIELVDVVDKVAK